MNTDRSIAAHARARAVIPGGVNSPVRAFGGVGGTPLHIARGEGAYLFDIDGNRYIDYIQSWGPLVLGHAHPDVVQAISKTAAHGTSFGAPCVAETELAELVISLVPSIEMIRFVNSGTEATMSALRLARAFTGRDRIVKFAGNYHGHADQLLVHAGSGVATLALPDSAGVPAATSAQTIVVPYNDPAALAAVFSAYPEQIAAVIVEPIAANMGFVLPEPGFLQGIQTLCRREGALFILDEVMTGFRAALGGTQALWGLDPDITCLGKVIGGGLPVGAYAGKRHIMEHVAPAGSMYQAGTLSGNPLAMAAGLETLRMLQKPGVFFAITEATQRLVEGLQSALVSHRIPHQIASVGTMFGLYFLKAETQRIRAYADAKAFADTHRYANVFHALLANGVYWAPSQFEAGFVSAAHTPAIIDDTITAFEHALSTPRR